MGNPSQSRGTPWMMCQWLEQMKRRSKRRIYLKMFLRLWAIKILLSLLIAWGFHHHIQWCACTGSPPHHIQLFRHGLFSASVIQPKTAFTFDVLDHFYMDSMECKTAGLSFFQKLRRFTNNAAPASIPVGLHHPSITLVSLLMDHLEPVQRAAMCVLAVAEPPGFEKIWTGHGQS